MSKDPKLEAALDDIRAVAARREAGEFDDIEGRTPPVLSVLKRRLDNDPEFRKEMRRTILGESDDDLIRKGDVMEILRDLKLNPLKTAEVQIIISKGMVSINRLPTHGSLKDKKE